MNTSLYKLLAIMPVLALLTSCGGGGGGTPSVALATITKDNAQAVAGDATGAATGAASGGSLAGTSAVSVTAGHSHPRFNLAAISKGLFSRVAARERLFTGNSVGALGVVLNQMAVPCDVSGTGDVQGEDADDNGEISSGDTITVTFHDCDDGDGRLNGTVVLSGLTLNGDPSIQGSSWDLAVTMSFSNFRFFDSGMETTLNGATDFTANSDGVVETDIIKTSSLTLAEGGETDTLSNFTLNDSVNSATGMETLSIDGTLINSVDGGVNLTTPTPLGILLTDDYPSSGILKATGANNTSCILNVLGNTNVRLDVDSDGDGTINTMINTTWMALENA